MSTTSTDLLIMDGSSNSDQTNLLDSFSTLDNDLIVVILNFLNIEIIFKIIPLVSERFRKFCLDFGCCGGPEATAWVPNQLMCKFLKETKRSQDQLFFWPSIKTLPKGGLIIPEDITFYRFTTSINSELTTDSIQSIVLIRSVDSYNLPSNMNSLKSFLHDITQNQKNLKCLLLRYIYIDVELLETIRKLNLKVLHFEYCHFQTGCELNFVEFSSLEKFLIKFDPNFGGSVQFPSKLDELLIYCPKSSKLEKKIINIHLIKCLSLYYM